MNTAPFSLVLFGVTVFSFNLNQIEGLLHLAIGIVVSWLTAKGLVPPLYAGAVGVALFTLVQKFNRDEAPGLITRFVKWLDAMLPTTPPPNTMVLFLLLLPLVILQPGCSLLSSVDSLSSLESDITDGVQLGASAEIASDPNSKQYFLDAQASLAILLATVPAQNLTSADFTNLDTAIDQNIPAQYQGVVNSVVEIAAQKYEQWYTANQATLTASNSGQYITGCLEAALAGLNNVLGPIGGTPSPAPAATTN